MEVKTEVLGENPIPVPLRARQNPKWLPLDRTWDSVDRGRRLTACVGNFRQKVGTSLHHQKHASQPSVQTGVANQVSVCKTGSVLYQVIKAICNNFTNQLYDLKDIEIVYSCRKT